jgi:predicted nuclease of predicted toxin-antitoxin system
VKILLDENLNWRLERFLPGHEVDSVPRIGWAGISNGDLLRRAQGQFDLLITMDGSMRSEQNLANFRIAVIALRALSNRLQETSPLMSQVLTLLPGVKPGTITVVRATP